MVVWLLDQFSPFLEQMELHSSGDSRVFLTARTAMASVTSFVMAILLGPVAIRWLKARFRERIASGSERLNEIQSGKESTPTMGGLFVVGAILFGTLVWGDLSSRNGLSIKQKFLVQMVLALVVGFGLYCKHLHLEHGLDLIWPFGGYALTVGAGFIVWSALVMVGSSNAVNLTDGLDGLASGCMVFAGSAFVALTYLAGHRIMSDYLSIPFVPGSGELSIVMGAMVGAVLGFLWFNCYPAQVFLGDTGSLPIGALLAFAALVTHQEVLLAVVGGIFVVETVSVIMQVAWFRVTGSRLIACSPLHNHYLFNGQHEIKIVVRFWIGSALLAIMAVASLKIR